VCDQWDWEKVITKEQRNLEFLKDTVRNLWKMITECEASVHAAFPGKFDGAKKLPAEITFVTPDEMHERWPGADIHEREDAAVKEWGAIFILGMGWPLKDGSAPEEVRAPDYDDWLMNGDIMVLHPVTGRRHELSSMGIRVDADALVKQCEHRGRNELLEKPFHKALLNNELPLCIGGGIGISRLVMLVTQSAHIGEVQCGVWHPDHVTQAEEAGCKIIPDHM
jgi:aspartate--ammonia ligase